ncbi:MAG: NAD-dependent epimerase/dehydratase family protein [Opitutales bacterium]
MERKKQNPVQSGLPQAVVILGCGFVGTVLARELMRAGVRVGALTRNPAKAAELRAMGLDEVVEAELDDSSWHERLTLPYAAAVNCVSSAGGGLEGYRKSYLEGQSSVLRWAEGRGLRTFIYTSSTSVYPQDGGVLVDETAPTEDAPDTGAVVRESEARIIASAHHFEQWFILRLCGIYGPGRHYLLDQLRSGVEILPGRGDYHLNTIYSEDIARALLRVLEYGTPDKSGIYNLSDGNPAWKSTVLKWLAGQLGRDPPRFDPDKASPRLQRRGGRMPDRKISNAKFRDTFQWSPAYPDYRAGYCAIIQKENPG